MYGTIHVLHVILRNAVGQALLLSTHLLSLVYEICISQKSGVCYNYYRRDLGIWQFLVCSALFIKFYFKVLVCTLSNKGWTLVSLRGTARYIWIFRLSDAYLPPSLSHIKQEISVYKNDYLQRSLIPWNKKGPMDKVSGKTGHLLLVLMLLSLFIADWCRMSLAT